MSDLATRADALALLIQTAVGSSVAVLAGVDPARIAGERYPEFIVIVPTGASYDPNVLLNDMAQEATWTWSLYIGTSYGGHEENGIDQADVILGKLLTGLQGQRLDTSCDQLELVERHSFQGYRPEGGMVYRQDWRHGTYAD